MGVFRRFRVIQFELCWFDKISLLHRAANFIVSFFVFLVQFSLVRIRAWGPLFSSFRCSLWFVNSSFIFWSFVSELYATPRRVIFAIAVRTYHIMVWDVVSIVLGLVGIEWSIVRYHVWLSRRVLNSNNYSWNQQLYLFMNHHVWISIFSADCKIRPLNSEFKTIVCFRFFDILSGLKNQKNI